MTRAISRDSFQELKNYLSVQFQQGRPILDADLNEAQAVALSLLRRLTDDSLGDGSPNAGFAVEALYPPPLERLVQQFSAVGSPLGEEPTNCYVDVLDLSLGLFFSRSQFFLTVPGALFDDFESGGFTLSSPQGRLRISDDLPYQGDGCLRLSGHGGTVTVSRLLDTPRDLSTFELATFRFRLNRQTPGLIRFFLEDDLGNRTVWVCGNPAFAADTWLAAVAEPLDIRFHIRTSTLPPAHVGQPYRALIATYGGTPPLTWTVTGDGLPPDLAVQPVGVPAESRLGEITFTPAALGTSSFDLTATDAAGGSATRTMSITVKDGQGDPTIDQFQALFEANSGGLGAVEAPTGTPVDLTAVRRYGFELYQDVDGPLVWDLDDLRLGNTALRERIAANNFLIRGSEFARLLRRMTLASLLMSGDGAPGADPENTAELLDLLNTELLLLESSFDSAGRYYLAGLPCIQVDDILYTDQADPNDPPLAPPPPGQIRRDAVYLDAWIEPVTFVQDPAIREVALGGPDTSTRERVRHRVRVAQGGRAPDDDGTGSGRLTTEGTYTARANRLYLVEIDRAGSIGTATFRWSNENASVVARVIEPIPPGSTVVVVEDASAFHPGDLVLLRKEFGAERHQVHQVTGNEITLASSTGDQLAGLPGSGSPGFTTFALTDRPMLQRWDGFDIAINADPADETISESIPLDDGVRLRFSGDAMRAGDYWSFTTRYLAGDEPAGIDTGSRIERLDFAKPRGVRHHYATLAVITRDGDSPESIKITDIEDRRMAVGGSSTRTATFRDVNALAGSQVLHLGGVRLPSASPGSKHVVFWSGDLYLPSTGAGDLEITASFYNDEMTDPDAEPGTGKIQDRMQQLSLRRRAVGVDIPLSRTFVNSGLGAGFFPQSLMIPTSVQFFARLSSSVTTISLTRMRVSIIELKKSH